jgi:hypothetical protein
VTTAVSFVAIALALIGMNLATRWARRRAAPRA